jgi:hypothetical protein
MFEVFLRNSIYCCDEKKCPVELFLDFRFKRTEEVEIVVLVLEDFPDKSFIHAAKLSN